MKSKHHIGGETNLVIMDLLKGLYVPNLSIPLDSIPHWNEKNPHFFNVLFSFWTSFLHNDGTFIIFNFDDLNVQGIS